MDIKSVHSVITLEIIDDTRLLTVLCKRLHNHLSINNYDDYKNDRIIMTRWGSAIQIIFYDGAIETPEKIFEVLNKLNTVLREHKIKVAMRIYTKSEEERGYISFLISNILRSNYEVNLGYIDHEIFDKDCNDMYSVLIHFTENCTVYPLIRIFRKGEKKNMKKEEIKNVTTLCNTCKNVNICKYTEQMKNITNTLNYFNDDKTVSPIAVSYSCAAYESTPNFQHKPSCLVGRVIVGGI